MLEYYSQTTRKVLLTRVDVFGVDVPRHRPELPGIRWDGVSTITTS